MAEHIQRLVEEESAFDFLQNNPAPSEQLSAEMTRLGYAKDGDRYDGKHVWRKRFTEHPSLIKVMYSSGRTVSVYFRIALPTVRLEGVRKIIRIEALGARLEALEKALTAPTQEIEQALKAADFNYDPTRRLPAWQAAYRGA